MNLVIPYWILDIHGTMDQYKSLLLCSQGAHTGGRSMLSPGSRLPPAAIVLEGTLVIPGSTDLKSEAKQYLTGTLMAHGTDQESSELNFAGLRAYLLQCLASEFWHGLQSPSFKVDSGLFGSCCFAFYLRQPWCF